LHISDGQVQDVSELQAALPDLKVIIR
jgi:hypothetical protein